MTKSKYRYYLIIEKNINSVIVFFSSLLMLCIALVPLKNVPYYIIFGKTVFFLYFTLLLFFLYAIRVLLTHKKIRYSVIDIIILIYGTYLLWNCNYNGLLFSNRALEIEACFILYIVLRSCQSIHSWSIIICVMLLGGILQGILGISQLLGLTTSNNVYFTITGSFYNPGPYGGYLASLYPIALGIKLYKDPIRLKLNIEILKSKITNYLLDICLIILLFTIIISQSRAAWCSTICVTIYFALYKIKNVKEKNKNFVLNKKKTTTVLLLCLIATSIIIYVLIHLRITSVAGRLYIWKISSNIVDKNNFLTGVGLNRFNPIYMIKQGEYLENDPLSPFSMLANNTEYCFNELFQSFIETGLIGLVLLVCIIFSILFIRNKNNREWMLIVKGGIISITLFSFFSYPFHVLPILLIFFVYIAFGAFLSPVGHIYILNKTLSHIMSFVLSISLCTICIFIYEKVSFYYQALKNWNTAVLVMANYNYVESLPFYKAAHSALYQNGYFLNDYGKVLYLMGNFSASNKILFEAANVHITSFTYLTIGLNYDKLDNFMLAEKYYKKAYWLCPERLYPLYLLVKLYERHGMLQEASSLGNIALHKKTKINSIAIKQMREEIFSILNNNKEQ